MLRKAVHACKEYLSRKKEQGEEIKQKKIFLCLLASKISGPTASELPFPLTYTSSISSPSSGTKTKAVLLVTSDIEIHGIKLTRSAVHLLPRASEISVDSLRHWALCVVDRGPGAGRSWCYDLMSDQMMLNMLGKSYARAYPVTEEMAVAWNSCSYMGETTRSHEEILELAETHISRRPRYNLLNNNCQHLAEELVRTLCEGRIVSQATLGDAFDIAQEKLTVLLKTLELERRRRKELEERGDKNNNKLAIPIGDFYVGKEKAGGGGDGGDGEDGKRVVFGLKVPDIDLDRISLRSKKSRNSMGGG